MNRNGQSAAREFRVSGHALSGKNARLDRTVRLDRRPLFVRHDSNIVLIDSDGDRIANDQIAGRSFIGMGYVGKIAQLDHETKTVPVAVKLQQFCRLIGSLIACEGRAGE